MNDQQTALVTGATNGIGKVTALELARRGYRVLLTSRDPSKGQKVLDELKAESGSEAFEVFVGDLSSMSDVRRIALEVREKHPKLDVLVNNAGGQFTERRESVDGFEYTFALNHLAYFLLTNLSLPSLIDAGDARVVNVSSSADRMASIHWDDPQFEENYEAFPAYAQSKLMNLLFSNALARRLRGTGVSSNVVDPGLVRSGFNYNPGGGVFIRLAFAVSKLIARSPEKGAQTSVYLATSPKVAGVSGAYFAEKKLTKANPLASDEDAQERLWRLSETLLSEWLAPLEDVSKESRSAGEKAAARVHA